MPYQGDLSHPEVLVLPQFYIQERHLLELAALSFAAKQKETLGTCCRHLSFAQEQHCTACSIKTATGYRLPQLIS
jgi:hypothetical protein